MTRLRWCGVLLSAGLALAFGLRFTGAGPDAALPAPVGPELVLQAPPAVSVS